MEPEPWLPLELSQRSVPIPHPGTFGEFDSNLRRREHRILGACWLLDPSASKDVVDQGGQDQANPAMAAMSNRTRKPKCPGARCLHATMWLHNWEHFQKVRSGVWKVWIV